MSGRRTKKLRKITASALVACSALTTRFALAQPANGNAGETVGREGAEGGRLELLGVADDVVHAFHLGKALGLALGGTAGDDQPSTGMLAAQPADGLLGLTHRLARHGAGVHDHARTEAGLGDMTAHHLGLKGVESAA